MWRHRNGNDRRELFCSAEEAQLFESGDVSQERRGRTPVWFAADPTTDIRSRDAKLYVYTIENTPKVKRIRNNPRVKIAPCNRTGGLEGDWIDANAKVVEGDEAARGLKLLTQKYFLKRVFDLFAVFRPTKREVLVITPA
jgi:PPOX class probable F420-dependent enzyme